MTGNKIPNTRVSNGERVQEYKFSLTKRSRTNNLDWVMLLRCNSRDKINVQEPLCNVVEQ